MVTIIKRPKTKLVRIFNCKCGCQFQADLKDFEISNVYISNNGFDIHEKLVYRTECPFCHIYAQYDDTNSEYKEIEVNVE